MPGRKSRYRRRSIKRSRCKAGPGEFCCNAITESGDRCSRKAAVVYHLSASIFAKVFPVLKQVSCCYFCTQHMIMIVNYLITKGIFWALKKSIRNIYEDPTSGKMIVGDYESIEKYAKERGVI